MLFNSYTFLGLVLLTFIFYYAPLFSKHQVKILIIASLVFYAYDQLNLLLLLISSAVINILISYYVIFSRESRKKILAATGVVLNLSILAFFKYSPLIGSSFFAKSDSIGHFLLTIPLPIGISFFTFEGISLLIDSFKEKKLRSNELVPQSLAKHAQRTLLFISFFPHLVAGPILKAHDFLPQIEEKKIAEIDWVFCFKKIVLGYFLKMVVADNLKDFTFWIAYPYFQSRSSIDLIVMLFGYSCQIFADFAGYSLIAIGFAKLFGYSFNENFNFPYISTSFKEFWKRWHISLSSFLMEYLYIPLGGNRKGATRTYINLMITMILGGLWHGGAWSYAIWGGFHGSALSIERFISDKFKIKYNSFINFMKGAGVFCLVTLAWLLFKLPEFSHVIKYFQSISNNFMQKDDAHLIAYILLYSSPVVLYHAVYAMRDTVLAIRIQKADFALYGIMLFLITVNSGSSGSFIYFQF
ncbi:MBOAT family O-acyltransferase [Ohtaekwangia sp.]|uniref:MBOAT family O-acyltransferase n=1 Tax=Ohtaekwangia sp. TaxID=2066019 RepID=UPI002FDCD37A